jgi:hypothetical protein
LIVLGSVGVERAVSSNGAKKRGNGVGVERGNWAAKESTGGGGGEETSYDKRGSSHCLREKIVCLGLGKLGPEMYYIFLTWVSTTCLVKKK